MAAFTPTGQVQKVLIDIEQHSVQFTDVRCLSTALLVFTFIYALVAWTGFIWIFLPAIFGYLAIILSLVAVFTFLSISPLGRTPMYLLFRIKQCHNMLLSASVFYALAFILHIIQGVVTIVIIFGTLAAAAESSNDSSNNAADDDYNFNSDGTEFNNDTSTYFDDSNYFDDDSSLDNDVVTDAVAITTWVFAFVSFFAAILAFICMILAAVVTHRFKKHLNYITTQGISIEYQLNGQQRPAAGPAAGAQFPQQQPQAQNKFQQNQNQNQPQTQYVQQQQQQQPTAKPEDVQQQFPVTKF